MYGVTLIVILAAAGGAIAYVGDRIGMKVGRKRLSIFGLRPKYTSIVITIITGVVVSGGTLAVLTLMSENVRTALFKTREIQEALAVAHSDLESKRAEVDYLSEQVGEVAGEYNQLKTEFDLVNSEFEQASKDRQKAIAALASVQSRLRESEVRLEDVKARYETAQSDLADAGVKLKVAQGEISAYQDERTRLEKNISVLSDIRDSLQSEADGLRAEAENLKTQIGLLKEGSASLMVERESSMLGQVVFPANQVILGSVIDGTMGLDAIDNQWKSFLLKVNDIAVRKGARSEVIDGDPFVITFDEANVLSAIQSLYQSNGKVILRAVSPVNSWYGEPLRVSLHVYPDKVIYPAGYAIAPRIIDGSLGSDKVQEELLALLQDVNSACIAEGMVTDEDRKVGTVITVSEFTSTIADIVNRNTKVVVEAVAEKDIWRSQRSPSVKLVVRPL